MCEGAQGDEGRGGEDRLAVVSALIRPLRWFKKYIYKCMLPGIASVLHCCTLPCRRTTYVIVQEKMLLWKEDWSWKDLLDDFIYLSSSYQPGRNVTFFSPFFLFCFSFSRRYRARAHPDPLFLCVFCTLITPLRTSRFHLIKKSNYNNNCMYVPVL